MNIVKSSTNVLPGQEEAARLADFDELMAKYRGRHHRQIEKEMRDRGWANFSRRILYPRTSGRGRRAGWIVERGWDKVDWDVSAPSPSAVSGPRASARERLCPHHAAMSVPSGGTAGGRNWMAEMTSPEDPDFQAWLKKVSPKMTWDWRHQLYIYERLKRVTDGSCKRLMVFMPPRHGKSELLTIHYAAYRLRHRPQMKVIVASYSQNLANKFSRAIRRVLSEDAALSAEGAPATAETAGAKRAVSAGDAPPPAGKVPCSACKGEGVIYPHIPRVASPQTMFPFVSSRPANSIQDWGTAAGGGLRAVGVGSGVTGYGADLVIIDDPVKNRAQAESETYRERVWDWYNNDIYTRLEADGAVILTQTRWHEDDLAGRLLKQMEEGGEVWEIIDLPALAEAQTGALADGEIELLRSQPSAAEDRAACGPVLMADWRRPGDALCPERFDAEKLAGIRSQIGTYPFSALYQQRPTPAEGAIFKREWFRDIVDAAPKGLRWFRGYDLAISTRTTADYTASFRVAMDGNGILYIADGFRERIEYPEQRRYLIERIRSERDTIHGIEDSMHGKAIVQDIRREIRLMQHAFKLVPVSNDKVTRALTWSPRAEDGKVKLVRGGWIEALLTELASFPNAEHDDQADAIAIAVKMLAQTGDRKVVFF